MNKKILALLVIILITILSIVVIAIKQKRAQNREAAKLELLQKFQLIKSQYDKAEALGINVFVAEELGKQAKQAFDSGDYAKTSELAQKILISLRTAGVPEPTPGAVPGPAQSNIPTPIPISTDKPTPAASSSLPLSQVKNAIVYERLGDARPKRTLDDQIQILKDTKAGMIFRASWRWNPQPNTCFEIPSEQKKMCEESGYSFEATKNMIMEIKKEIPNIIIIGAVPAQKINRNEVNEITGETFDETQTWQMALDPAKWEIKNPTKDEFQGKITGSISGGYFPDITNPNYQEILLSWAKRQVDAGMDGIWIDLLYTQAGQLAKITKDANHPGVKESYEAASKIVDEIHSYGNSKGKYIYVGTWQVIGYPYTPPKLDFITITPTSQEISNKYFDAAAQDKKIAEIKNTYPNIPIFSFIDWSDDGAPLSVFSQKLSKDEQRLLLKTADEFYSSRDVNFIYPVHGGNTGSSSTVIAYGKYKWYDVLAPEFDTFDTIMELAKKKALN